MLVIERGIESTNEAVSGCSPYIFYRLQIVWKNTREVILWEDTSSKLGYQVKGILDYHVFQASSSNTLSQGCKAPWLWRWAWNAWSCFWGISTRGARATNGIPTFGVGANTTFGIFCWFNISGSHGTKKVVLQACLPLSATHHSIYAGKQKSFAALWCLDRVKSARIILCVWEMYQFKRNKGDRPQAIIEYIYIYRYLSHVYTICSIQV